MSKKLLFFLIVLALPMVSVAGAPNGPKNNIAVSSDAVIAKDILNKIPMPSDLSNQIKSLYASAQTERAKGNIKGAIRFYRRVLDQYPDFARARFELSLCYMAEDRWDRADYYLRLAMASENLPKDVIQVMESYRALVRKNKNWDFWFEFGDVPDIRSSIVDNDDRCTGGICEELTDTKISGANFSAGADYEFKLSDNWRWKSDASFQTNLYSKDNYNDLNLSGSTGPRYVWDRGDVWVAGVVSRTWYSHKPYAWSYGAKVDTNYDLTRKLSSGLVLLAMNNSYDEYNDMLAGQTYAAIPHITYYIDTTKYFELLGEVGRETSKFNAYANYNYGFGFEFGMELPYAFIVSLTPYFFWEDYDGELDIIKNGDHQKIKQKDFIQKYTLAVTNTRLELFGFMPVFKLNYTMKESNIQIPEYSKWSFGLGIKRKF